MRNQMTTGMSVGMSWAAACAPSFASAPEVSLMTAYALVDERLEVDGARPRDVQQVQVEQGQHAFAGISPIAPTALKVADKADEAGPYPWRQPV
jgi:hypothetical protein